ncbi:hypothetical protein N0V90_009743 [Kalmusia sp. IMI 367209]|nr:hypothetical protein N0V90_009743 [Kalmusia sp. IMI 367209]
MNLCRKADLASLRLTNRTFESIATPLYFASVPLHTHWSDDEGEKVDPPWPNGIDYDAPLFANVLDNERLKKLVKKVDVYMCNSDCDHHPHWSNAWSDSIYEEMPSPRMSKIWLECYKRLPKLPNLGSVALVFDRHGGSGYDDDEDEDLIHTREAREKAQFDLFKLLGGRIRELGIRHLQLFEDPDDEDEEQDQESRVELRNRALSSLTALRLAVVHEQPVIGAGTVLKVPPLQTSAETLQD